ncbi:hypothetical protein F0562_006209 [Nyssa sinensis]|uniref:Uncharacterized protein n=1 Tax=Nyssa sinensis TaxID=561372 RepID=A0A5J5AMK1_9ASTE|nr:hypothetical protein F0562_006209 [Nyssa sinensis]
MWSATPPFFSLYNRISNLIDSFSSMLSLTPFHFIVLRCFKISPNLRHALQRTFGFFRCFCWCTRELFMRLECQ